jgi:hypothetical protein
LQSIVVSVQRDRHRSGFRRRLVSRDDPNATYSRIYWEAKDSPVLS